MGAGSVFLGTALDLAMSLPDYSQSRRDGHGVMYSVGKTALTTMLYASPAAPIMWGITGAQVLSAVGEFGAQAGRQSALTMTNAYKQSFGGNFVDTKGAYTMRQRGVQAIQNSGMNARSILGNEARTYHRSVNTW